MTAVIPSVTVAIPTYNGARHLAEAIRGILSQEDPPFDLLICDDRSEDETLEVARRVAGDRARIEVHSERLGLAGNWNQCVLRSRTPLVAIFHQDDVMMPGHLAGHREALAADDRIGMACGDSTVIDSSGRPLPEGVIERGGLGPRDRTFTPGELLPMLAASNPLRCSTVLLRAEAHHALGGFDPSYRYVVDWEFWLRLARGWGVAWRASPTVAVRWHPASETQRFRSGTTDLEETLRLLDLAFDPAGPGWIDSDAMRRQARRRLARAYLNRAYELLGNRDEGLARRCLRTCLELHPATLGTIARDPRLAVRMAALALSPRLARLLPSPGRRGPMAASPRPSDPGRDEPRHAEVESPREV